MTNFETANPFEEEGESQVGEAAEQEQDDEDAWGAIVGDAGEVWAVAKPKPPMQQDGGGNAAHAAPQAEGAKPKPAMQREGRVNEAHAALQGAGEKHWKTIKGSSGLHSIPLRNRVSR